MKIYLVHLKEKSREIQKAAARKLLAQLGEEPTELIYGSHGKPYLKGNPWYFNISHSGEYLLFVQGQYEVGADIQMMRPCNVERLARKCCTEEERQWILERRVSEVGMQNADELAATKNEEDRLKRFYHVWCRKEAYGKYLGCGLTEEVFTKNTQNPLDTIAFLEYDILEGYHICICCKKEEEREETVHLLEGL